MCDLATDQLEEFEKAIQKVEASIHYMNKEVEEARAIWDRLSDELKRQIGEFGLLVVKPADGRQSTKPLEGREERPL